MPRQRRADEYQNESKRLRSDARHRSRLRARYAFRESMIASSAARERVGFGSFTPTTLDRYMVAELSGPFTFGISAFMLIFVATNLLSLSRLITEEHAPLWAAIEYFLWSLPQVVPYVLPMATLLGVLLAMQRLSGESEITAMKAGGV